MPLFTHNLKAFKDALPADRNCSGKHHTMKIESSNAILRHNTIRFTRQTKAVSQSIEMINLTLKLHPWIQNPENFFNLRDKFLSIF